MTTTIFHMSDPHFGTENREALEIFASEAKDARADLILCTGDLTQRATHAQYDAAAEYFDQFDAPAVLCPGNHDMAYYNLWERFTDPYRRFRKFYEGIDSDFESDDCVLVPLKTTVRAQPRFPWSDGYVREEALEKTRQHLHRLAGDTRLRLVTCHHPLQPAREGETNPTIGGDEAFAAIAAGGADAVISGHVHIPFDIERASGGTKVRMIGSGTLSTRLRGEPASYSILTCSREDGIALERRVIAHANPVGHG